MTTMVGLAAPRSSAISSRSSAVAEPLPSVRSTMSHEPASVAASTRALNTSFNFVKMMLLMELSPRRSSVFISGSSLFHS